MERLLAYAQIGFSALVYLLFAVMLVLVYMNSTNLGEAQLATLNSLLDQLTILVAVITTYWFSRQRPSTPTDRKSADDAPPPAEPGADPAEPGAG